SGTTRAPRTASAGTRSSASCSAVALQPTKSTPARPSRRGEAGGCAAKSPNSEDSILRPRSAIPAAVESVATTATSRPSLASRPASRPPTPPGESTAMRPVSPLRRGAPTAPFPYSVSAISSSSVESVEPARAGRPSSFQPGPARGAAGALRPFPPFCFPFSPFRVDTEQLGGDPLGGRDRHSGGPRGAQQRTAQSVHLHRPPLLPVDQQRRAGVRGPLRHGAQHRSGVDGDAARRGDPRRLLRDRLDVGAAQLPADPDRRPLVCADQCGGQQEGVLVPEQGLAVGADVGADAGGAQRPGGGLGPGAGEFDPVVGAGVPRSEEHTSELQSREKIVC